MGGLLRVGTYNLYLGADLSLILGPRSSDELAFNRLEVQRQLAATAFPQRASAIAALLVRERLDLVGLQEVCTWHLEGELIWDFEAELLSALDKLGEPYDVLCSQATFGGTGEVAGDDGPVQMRLRGSNVILARRNASLEVESTSSGMFGSTLRMPADTTMVAIARGWCAARCRYGGAEFSFVNTHTEAYAEDWRDRQRDELLKALPPDSERVIVVGDFNATPDRVGMPSSYVDAWTAAGHASDDPSGATCCQAADLRNEASTLVERIDYVWARGFDVQSAQRFGGEPDDRHDDAMWPSDHAGVAVEVTPQP